jgi:nucleoside phosphorylase
VFHFGSCGALTAAAQAGDTILPEAITDGKEELAPDHDLTVRLRAGHNGHGPGGGRLYSSAVVLKNPAEKAAAQLRTGAGFVDMESFTVASACRRRAISYVAARGVFDVLQDDLTALGEPYHASGELAPARLAVNLITHPRLILALPALRQKARRVEEGLLPLILRYVVMDLP